ncbi:hypothetical protein PHISCL_10677 [Aspergillus sclerotialis]|uniref:Uncharacterized protein n=1 Tax=Aspergillus sclerotialis TaxID=2070753 RepID=A0A3A2Z287_9EURO|nr:hypothetical protein PHISCL_10677 [Aspergillus sclerotialis]
MAVGLIQAEFLEMRRDVGLRLQFVFGPSACHGQGGCCDVDSQAKGAILLLREHSEPLVV